MMRQLLEAAFNRQVGVSALQRAQAGLTSAGRGPFQVEPGETVQVFQCAGDTTFGRQHTVSFDVDQIAEPVDGAARSPLVGIVEFGNDGTQGRFEVDVKRGTCISVPFGTVNVSVRNGGVVEGEDVPVARTVSAFVNKYPYARRFSATRTLRVPALAAVGDAPANASPPIRIPAYATDLTWIRGLIGSTFQIAVQWLDVGGNVIGIVEVGVNPLGYPVPNGAEFFRVVNSNGSAIDPSLAVFSLSF